MRSRSWAGHGEMGARAMDGAGDPRDPVDEAADGMADDMIDDMAGDAGDGLRGVGTPC